MMGHMDGRGVLNALEALVDADVASADGEACGELLGLARVVRGRVDAIEARVGSRLSELHDTAGGAPVADQHTRCGGVSASEGRRKERRSETIEQAPAFGEALADGHIGAEHVDALANATAKLDHEVRAGLFDRVDDLLSDATRMSPERFGRSCRDLARRLERDQGIERNRRQRAATYLSRRIDPATGMVVGRYAFHPELANRVFGAVDREVAAMIADGERRNDAEFARGSVDRNRLAAEALGRLVGSGHANARPAEADITLIVDLRTLTDGFHEHTVCETSEGLPLPPSSVRRLVCQGRIAPIIVDGQGTALDAGRTIRHANRRQRRALRAMYRTCGLGDCDVPFDRCEMHHVVAWEHGGASDLHNLLPLCSRHHHTVHELGWTLDLAVDRTVTVRQVDGAVVLVGEPDVPPQRRPVRTRRRAAA